MTGFVGNDASAVFIEAQGTPRAVSEFTRRLSAEPPPARPDQRDQREAGGAAGRGRLPDRRLHQRRRPAHLHPARRRHLRRLPAGAVRTGQPAVPPPLHHLHRLRPPVHDHQGSPVRPPGDHDGGLPDVRTVRARVPRSGRPPVPRPADRLPRLRPDAHGSPATASPPPGPMQAIAAAQRVLAEGGIVAVKGIGGYHLACRADCPETVTTAQGAQGARRQAVRGADQEPVHRPAAGRDRPGRAAVADRRGPPDRAAAPAARGAGRRHGRAGQPAARGAAALRAGPPPAALPGSRQHPAGTAHAGSDQREHQRRADRLRRRGGGRPADLPGRRGAHPRPADPRAVRRLGGPGAARRRAADQARSGLRPAPGAVRTGAADGARGRRRGEELVLPHRRRQRLLLRSHRRHGQPSDAARVRPRRHAAHDRAPGRPRR